MRDEDMTPGARAPLWMRILLVVSLAANLLVAGALIGAAVTGGGPWRGHGMHGGGGPMAQALSEADRRLLWQRLKEGGEAPMPDRGTQRATMQELIALLRASPYDAQAVSAQMETLRAQLVGRMSRGQALLAEHLAQMSEAERAAYADRLEEAVTRRRWR